MKKRGKKGKKGKKGEKRQIFENRFCQIHPKTAKKLPKRLTILISIEFFRLSAGN